MNFQQSSKVGTGYSWFQCGNLITIHRNISTSTPSTNRIEEEEEVAQLNNSLHKILLYFELEEVQLLPSH